MDRFAAKRGATKVAARTHPRAVQRRSAPTPRQRSSGIMATRHCVEPCLLRLPTRVDTGVVRLCRRFSPRVWVGPRFRAISVLDRHAVVALFLLNGSRRNVSGG